MLYAKNLRKSYDQRSVVDGISLSVLSGEVVGLLGPNGAGKTTTVGMLYGIVQPNSGEITINGVDLLRDPRRAKATIGVVPQEDNLDVELTAAENLERFATYYGRSLAAGKKRARELLEQVGLVDHGDKRIEELSGGMKRRLVLARALLNDPALLFLDEPTTGLDPDARQDFWRLIMTLKQAGKGVLLTTHYMEEAERLCSRVLLILSGRVLDEGTPEELIARHVGEAICEVEGLSDEQAELISKKFSVQVPKFSTGRIVPLPQRARSEVLAMLDSFNPSLKEIRKANLEDVFLSLTGLKL